MSVNELDNHIKMLLWKLQGLKIKKQNARSLTEFYNYGKLIRSEHNKIRDSINVYIKLENVLNLPVKLEYRYILRKLK